MPEAKEIIIESKKHGTVTVLLDQKDWDKVKDYKWHMSSDGYVRAKIKDPKGRTRIKNARLISVCVPTQKIQGTASLTRTASRVIRA